MKESCLSPTLPSKRTTRFSNSVWETSIFFWQYWRIPVTERPAAAGPIGWGTPSPSPLTDEHVVLLRLLLRPGWAAFWHWQRWPVCLRTRIGWGNKISLRDTEWPPNVLLVNLLKERSDDPPSPSACNSLMLSSILHDLTPAFNFTPLPNTHLLDAMSSSCTLAISHLLALLTSTMRLLLKAWAKVTSATQMPSVYYIYLSLLLIQLLAFICLTFYSRL